MVATETKWLQMKQCRVGHVQESIKGCNRITCLSHELLIEILLRLPNCKSVVRCQSVCKRWATVASDPWFISQFIDLKLRDGLPFGIVMWYKPNRYSLLWDGSESFFTRSIFDTRDSSFSPFPGLDDVHASATLVASCNDLLLYSRHEKGNKYDLYISNVQTRQWVALPSPPCYSSVLLYGLSSKYSKFVGIFCGLARKRTLASLKWLGTRYAKKRSMVVLVLRIFRTGILQLLGN
ncbi:hypothetical protein RND81_08G049200 [Saponaria officinalis]|uniref:F-box domain-containing protein n=1 Tax=Saponaria officinalis TaxID=3572 RepID=A0AAW1J2L2_SAPOF